MRRSGGFAAEPPAAIEFGPARLATEWASGKCSGDAGRANPPLPGCSVTACHLAELELAIEALGMGAQPVLEPGSHRWTHFRIRKADAGAGRRRWSRPGALVLLPVPVATSLNNSCGSVLPRISSLAVAEPTGRPLNTDRFSSSQPT